MKKVTHLLSGLVLLGITITTNAQISTSTGSATNVLPNNPTTNTNVLKVVGRNFDHFFCFKKVCN